MADWEHIKSQWMKPPPPHFSNPHGIIGMKQTPSQVVASIIPNQATWDTYPHIKHNYTTTPNVTITTVPLVKEEDNEPPTVDMEVD